MTAPAKPGALGVECPKCMSGVDVPCYRVVVSRDGFWSSKLRPHAARIRAAEHREKEEKP